MKPTNDGDWNEADRELLEARAAELARPLEDGGAGDDRVPVLEFVSMGNRYAVALESIEAVTRIGDIVPIPLTPPHISGIVRRRGDSIALVSPRRYFHPGSQGIADADYAVIVEVRGKRFALQVDDIEGVTFIEEDELKPPPENFDPQQLPFIAGVSVEGLTLIDLEALADAPGFGMS
jgi:purine-binding chemotaxis protein CheW